MSMCFNKVIKMNKIINNKAYYYIAAEKRGKSIIAYHLFLLFSVEDTVIHCDRGIGSQSSWNITAESSKITLTGSNKNNIVLT